MQPNKIVTDKSIKSSARAHKKELELKKKERGQKSVHDEDKEWTRQEKREQKTKRKGAFASDAIGDSSLFDDEKVAFTKKAKTEEKRPSRYVFC
jgi:hypothetical protein